MKDKQTDISYHFADLSQSQLHKLQEIENMINMETGKEIIILAYSK